MVLWLNWWHFTSKWLKRIFIFLIHIVGTGQLICCQMLKIGLFEFKACTKVTCVIKSLPKDLFYKWIYCTVLILALQKKPEEINRRSSDMWSFAILLWELVTREVPFADLSNMEIGMKVGLTLGHSFIYIENLQELLFSHTLRLACLASSFRFPWRAWGPPSHLEYRHTFASSWRYAWTKTRRRGLSLIWLCQFWKKCRTNKKKKKNRNPSAPSCTEPDPTNGGVVLTSIALKSYSAAAFKATVASASERNSAAATSFIFFIFNCDVRFSFVSLCHWFAVLQPGTLLISTIFSFLDWITCGCQHGQSLALL